MSTFIEDLKLQSNISFKSMREVAVDQLKILNRQQQDTIYDELRRGKGILDDDNHLNMYLRSYGNMHLEKLNAAFACVSSINEFANCDFEIYDWGCGQGTASICLLDYLRNYSNIHVDRVTLIDPSFAALNRAKSVIQIHDKKPNEIRLVSKGFDSLLEDDIKGKLSRKIHLFSNILDVEFFDLAVFTHLFQRSFTGKNLFICVGPFYTNNKRVDDFIHAIEPDTIFANQNFERGQWKKEWSMSLRVFDKNVTINENVNIIRKRITDAHKKQQYFAGYILDSVSEELTTFEENNCDRYNNGKLPDKKDWQSERLLKSLSSFDVQSNKELEHKEVIDSKWAVVNNIITRGIPTLATSFVEQIFSKEYGISDNPTNDNDHELRFKSKRKLVPSMLFEALHVIDPRFDKSFYNSDMLESDFERRFIKDKLSQEDSEYLIQLLEPQRNLSSLVRIPNQKFTKDRRVDFALEVPYKSHSSKSSSEAPAGFIIEIDGTMYHSNIYDRIRDQHRDSMASQNNWETFRLSNISDDAFIRNWDKDTSDIDYLSIVRSNYGKHIEGEWRNHLEAVLTPLAVARIQKMIIEAVLCGHLSMSQDSWRIAVIERDVPCAAIAVSDLKSKFETLSALDGTKEAIPSIQLDIVSTPEFRDSKLHIGHIVYSEQVGGKYDLCIDISMLLRDNIDVLPLTINAATTYLVRTSHYKKGERCICCAPNIQYLPLVLKDERGEYNDINEQKEILTYFLKEIFRKPSFRKGQLPIISRSLSNQTTIGLLPTGGGKSLTYQLSSVLQPGVTLVVDPLISLMVDQHRGLNDIRIDATACVNSTMKREEREQSLANMQNGNLLFILLSPERFMMTNFRESLQHMSSKNHVYFSYGVIDEVHCVSEWGHDFRPSYLHLGRNMIRFMQTQYEKQIALIGLTATASFDVLADVERELTLGGNLSLDSEAIVRPENDSRPELTYKIIRASADFNSIRNNNLILSDNVWDLKKCVATSKKQALYDLLKQIPADLSNINQGDCKIDGYAQNQFYCQNDKQEFPYAGIVFCPHARGTFGVNDIKNEGIANYLMNRDLQLSIGTFVGGSNTSGDMKLFNENKLNLMVATKAFGMGIDKPNVRYTVNLNHPSSIESYVQEAGRGGRDRKNAISYLLYEPTEYIHLTIDKINDIRYLMGADNDPQWLENYRNKNVLVEDFPGLCAHNGCSAEQTDKLISICSQQGFFENEDKNIELWFHNNSFRGLYKETVILKEMTDRILNVKPTRILEVQESLREELGSTDYRLRLNLEKNSLTVVSDEDSSQQYGYLFLNNLHATYRYANLDSLTCQTVMNTLINILREYPQHDATWLNHPIDEFETDDFGIYSSMKDIGDNDYVYVTVSWENQIKQNPDEFRASIISEINKIANNDIDKKERWNVLNEARNGNLNLEKIADFPELLSKIAKISDDPRWLIYHGNSKIYEQLKNAFCKKRDKDDTDKAIYRMCCIGLVEDVTIDYNSQTYQLMIRKRTDEEYLGFMLDFFKKYYSLEQALVKVQEIQDREEENVLEKCLSYLAEFVYNNLEKKRFRAIEDMRLACEEGLEQGEDWLKEFIHLYFNSKYARDDYKIDGECYSLKMDTDKKSETFDLVKKYINAMRTDSSGSEVDNVKHLYGATLLVLRAHPEHAVLHLLRTYCISFLGTGMNQKLQEDSLSSYVDGFIGLDKSGSTNLIELIDEYNSLLSISNDDFVKTKLIKDGRNIVLLYKHSNWFNEFANKY